MFRFLIHVKNLNLNFESRSDPSQKVASTSTSQLVATLFYILSLVLSRMQAGEAATVRGK